MKVHLFPIYHQFYRTYISYTVTVPVQLTLKLSRALRPQSRLKGIVLLRRIRLSAGGSTDRDWLSEAYVNRAPLSALFFSP
jgi:hypothetical protein